MERSRPASAFGPPLLELWSLAQSPNSGATPDGPSEVPVGKAETPTRPAIALAAPA